MLEPAQVKRASDSISVLIVDDEAPARRRLAELLSKDRDVGWVRQADNGLAAISLIQHSMPDILFLDVQMPGVDGLGVIDAIGAENMPLTVFVTAYDRFALQAFEADAIDYLLKPFGDGRFERTMERVKKRLVELRSRDADGRGAVGPELLKLVSQRSRPGEIWRWIVIRNRESTRLVMAEEIDWVQAAGVYVTVHAGGEEYLYRASLATFARRLDPLRFVRIHRSSIVNLNSIASLERRSHGEFDVILKSGSHLMLSRTYRPQFEAMLGQVL